MYYSSDAPAPLTRADLVLMRDAVKVCFDHAKPSRNPTGMGAIRLTVAVPYRKTTIEHEETMVVGTKLESFAKFLPDVEGEAGRIDVDYTGDDLSCFGMFHTPMSNDQWQTVVALAKPGDRLWLRWRRGNQNGYMDDAGLVLDELFLVLERARSGDRAPQHLTFQMLASVCQANSARLIRTRRESPF